MAEDSSPQFVSHDDSFKAVIGLNPTLTVIIEDQSCPFAHEAGVFIPAMNELFITSNQFIGLSGKKEIKISKVKLGNGEGPYVCEIVQTENVPMVNGGVNYLNGILFCAQGTLDSAGGLAFMEISPPYRSHCIIRDFYGQPFNSVNDVIVHSDGSMWFTDPIYGYDQGFRPKPQLPGQVYRFDPKTGAVRAMADGFQRPNGICFSPDESVVYITDMDFIHGDGTTDLSRVSSIYAFDLIPRFGQPFLTARRLFAMANIGVPDGIKCDLEGNVYSGCGDGVNVWSPGGVLLGRILAEGGVGNFCFGRDGEMFFLNENKIWRAQLAKSVKGALLRI